MAKEWSVRVETALRIDEQGGVLVASALTNLLHEYAAAVSGGEGDLTFQLSIEADSIESAVTKGVRTVLWALKKSVFDGTRPGEHPLRADVVAVEAESAAHFAARVDAPGPELVGIAELAGVLGVSRARASAIAARRDFPAPTTKLAAGPVWFKANLNRWLEEYRGGRKTTKPWTATTAKPSRTKAAARV